MDKEYRDEVLDRYASLLYYKYKNELSQWDWEAAKEEALNYCVFEEDYIIAGLFIGTVFSTYPSGKYWVFWACSNTTELERIRDTAFSQALRDVSEEHNCWVEGGEGDPCDLYLKYVVDDPTKDIMFVSDDYEKEYKTYLQESK
jgi:hypothetical protein